MNVDTKLNSQRERDRKVMGGMKKGKRIRNDG